MYACMLLVISKKSLYKIKKAYFYPANDTKRARRNIRINTWNPGESDFYACGELSKEILLWTFDYMIQEVHIYWLNYV